MGYSTDFNGSFKINKPVDEDTAILLRGLNATRRMKRDIGGYGIDGEFYIEDETYGVVNYNVPPSTQPGLWCQWMLVSDDTIMWDGGEKFYNYVEWIEYIINSVLKPRGYVLNGEVEWVGEDSEDIGKIVVKDNMVDVLSGIKVYV